MKNCLLLGVGMIVSFSACQKTSLSEPEVPQQNKITLTIEEAERLPLLSDNHTISHEEAVGYARSLLAARSETGTKVSDDRPQVIDSIVAVYPAVTKSGDAAEKETTAKIYVVGIGTDGYVLVSSDIRTQEKILCYSDESSFAEAQTNPGFRYAMSCMTDYVAAEVERVESLRGDSIYVVLCKKLGLDARGGATKGWAEDHNGEFTNIRVEPQGETWTELGPRIGPLLSTKWDQYAPYNSIIQQNTGQNYPVGCVATAVAQIMNYHKKGSYNGHTYRWGEFSTYGASTEAGRLDLGQLFWALGLPANLNMNYKIGGSGAFSDNVPRTFANFGYTCGQLTELSVSEIEGPIYARGENKNGSGLMLG
ncbi:C10 family peptidase [uncultured Rikenella sp.]|uniref:C10 family peptidase n=1 Tax=uncultured Rikenella sp. TaxID=368003 RepID=UPI002633FE10|nr:C10 family peptidase [uncultured Rikenella sp.]